MILRGLMLQCCLSGKMNLITKQHWNVNVRNLVILLCKSRVLVESYCFLTYKWKSSAKKKEAGRKYVSFNSLSQSDNDAVGEGALIFWWDLEEPSIPGIYFLSSLGSCLDSPQQLWIEAEIQKNLSLWKKCYFGAGCFTMVCVGDARRTVASCFYVITPVIIIVLWH